MNRIAQIIERYNTKQELKDIKMYNEHILEQHINHSAHKEDSADLDRIEQLVRIRNEYISNEKKDTVFNKLDVNTILKVGAGLIGAGAILKYEYEDIITTKSFGIMSKFIGI